MSTSGRLFWTFCFLFYIGGMLLAVHQKEAGIAAIFGLVLGMATVRYANIRSKRST